MNFSLDTKGAELARTCYQLGTEPVCRVRIDFILVSLRFSDPGIAHMVGRQGQNRKGQGGFVLAARMDGLRDDRDRTSGADPVQSSVRQRYPEREGRRQSNTAVQVERVQEPVRVQTVQFCNDLLLRL